MSDKEMIIKELVDEIVPKLIFENFHENETDDFKLVVNQSINALLDKSTNLTSVLNSISFIKLLVSIEEFYDIEFGEEELDISLFENIGSLADSISDKLLGKEEKVC